MDTASAGIVLLVLIGFGCSMGMTLAAVLLRRLHTAAQAEYDRLEMTRRDREESAREPADAPAAHPKA